MTFLLSGAPAFGATGTPAQPPPGTGADARWNASSVLKPALIMQDFTWFAGHQDPKEGRVRLFTAVDIENGILFVATGQGLQIVDVRQGPTTSESSYIYGYYYGGSFPGWAYSDADWFIYHLDAPAGNPNILGLSMDVQGFSIIKTATLADPVVAYHATGPHAEAKQLYSVRSAGTDWAYVINSNSQVIRFSLSAASGLSNCTEAPPATVCPNVYKGVVGSLGPGWGTLHGTGNFLATGKWLAGGLIKIWSLTNPAEPSPLLQINAPALGVAMWQSGSSHYLARLDAGKKLWIHDVSCIAAGACTSAPVVWSKQLTAPKLLTQVTVSQAGERTYLYIGGDDYGSCVAQREYLFDVTTPESASTDDLTPKVHPDGYWGWYYQDCATGFNLVGPRVAKVYASEGGTHLYRAAGSLLDAHSVEPLPSPPVADFIFSPTTEIYPGTPVQFIDRSVGHRDQWTWTFQGGSPAGSTVPNPAGVTFASAGSKTVTLKVGSSQNGPGTRASKPLTVLDPLPVVGDVAASPAQILPGQPVTFTATGVTGKPPLIQAWTIQGPGGPVANGSTNPFEWVTTASAPAGTYTATFTASNNSGSASKSTSVIVGAATEPMLLPWVGKAADGPLVQSSDLYLHNPGAEAITVTLELIPRGNAGSLPPVQRTIAANATLFVSDAVKSLFGLDNMTGFLSVKIDQGNVQPVLISFNTTFRSGGEFGQTIPGFVQSDTRASAITGNNQVQHLVGLNDNDERLAYFGFSNPADSPVTYTLRFFDNQGEAIGTGETLILGRRSAKQFQTREIRTRFGLTDKDDYRVMVETPRNARLFPYGANVRIGSADPSFLTVGTGAERVYLLGALSTPGMNKSIWRSDLVLANTGNDAAITDFTFTNVGPTSRTTDRVREVLRPGETLRLADVIGTKWGIRNGVGVLTIDSDVFGDNQFPVIQGESYENTNPAKRYGQTLPALTDAQAAGPGQGQYLVGLRQDAKYRTTFWMFNTDSQAGLYDVVFRNLEGQEVGRLANVGLGAGKLRQLNQVQFPAGLSGGFTVQILVKQGKGLAAAQVVNNVTNDPAYVQGETR